MDPRGVRVVGLAVVPNELYVIEHILNTAVVLSFHLPLQRSQVHGVLHDREIVGETHAFPVDGLAEIEGVVGLVEAVYYDL